MIAKYVLLLLAVGLTGQHPNAEEPPALMPFAHYLSSGIGNLWWFEPAGETGEPWVLTVSEEEEVLERRTHRWENDTGGYQQLTWSEDEGLLLLGSHTFAGPTIYFDEPLVLLPPEYELGTSHRAEAEIHVAEGATENSGKLTSQLRATRGPETITPAGRFEDCLMVEISLELKTEETTTNLDLDITLAAGVGPIRIKTSGTGTELDLVLAEARVGSTSYPRPD